LSGSGHNNEDLFNFDQTVIASLNILIVTLNSFLEAKFLTILGEFDLRLSDTWKARSFGESAELSFI